MCELEHPACPHERHWHSAAAAAVLVLIVVTACSSSAHASSVSRFGDTIVYEGSVADRSDVRISQTGTQLVFRERSENVVALSGCVAITRTRAACGVAETETIVVLLGARNDRAVVANSVALPVLIRGGLGNDALTGGRSADDIKGDDGDDRIDGGSGDDTVSGGDDDDELAGARGDDVLVGGTGNDSILGLDGGTDVVECGAGIDTARVGSSDELRFHCDLVAVNNTRALRCDPGAATAGLEPKLPKRPSRMLRVKVTSASVPVVIVRIRIWFKSPLRHVDDQVAVRTNGRWKNVRRVGPEYTGSRPQATCAI